MGANVRDRPVNREYYKAAVEAERERWVPRLGRYKPASLTLNH